MTLEEDTDSSEDEGCRFFKGMDLQKVYIGSDEKKLGRALRNALWGRDGLQTQMIEPGKSGDFRSSVDAKRYRFF